MGDTLPGLHTFASGSCCGQRNDDRGNESRGGEFADAGGGGGTSGDDVVEEYDGCMERYGTGWVTTHTTVEIADASRRIETGRVASRRCEPKHGSNGGRMATAGEGSGGRPGEAQDVRAAPASGGAATGRGRDEPPGAVRRGACGREGGQDGGDHAAERRGEVAAAAFLEGEQNGASGATVGGEGVAGRPGRGERAEDVEGPVEGGGAAEAEGLARTSAARATGRQNEIAQREESAAGAFRGFAWASPVNGADWVNGAGHVGGWAGGAGCAGDIGRVGRIGWAGSAGRVGGCAGGAGSVGATTAVCVTGTGVVGRLGLGRLAGLGG
jgi:hypothetical protein